jgi:hypothetical protein
MRGNIGCYVNFFDAVSSATEQSCRLQDGFVSMLGCDKSRPEYIRRQGHEDKRLDQFNLCHREAAIQAAPLLANCSRAQLKSWRRLMRSTET